MKNNNFIFLLFFIFILFLSIFSGCKKKKEAPPPTPTPTFTPIPHMEKIVYTYNGHLFWMNTDGSGVEELFPDNTSKWFPAVSPDGWYVSYWVHKKDNYNLYIGNLKTLKSYQITFDDADIDFDIQNFNIRNWAAWSNDGNFLIYSRFKDLWKINNDGFDQIALTNSHNCISPDISKDNKIVFSKIENESSYNLFLKSIDSLNEERLTNYKNKKAVSPCFSPDMKKIIFSLIEKESVNIFSIDLNSKFITQLSFDGKSFSPVFSHDGRKIIFSSTITNKFQPEIWMMNSDGSGRIRLTKNGGVSPAYLYRLLEKPLPTSTPTPKMYKKEKELKEEFELEEKTMKQTPIVQETKVEIIETPQMQLTPPKEETLIVQTERRGNKLYIYPVIHFDTGKAVIKKEFYPLLKDMAKIIKKYPKSPVYIYGHTDNIPIHTKKYPNNYVLSLARAKVVRKHLVKLTGFSSKKFKVKGYGPDKPIVPNTTKEYRYRNRRAEIAIDIVKSEQHIVVETGPTKTPTYTPSPTPTFTPTPTPKLNIFQKIFKRKKTKKKLKKEATW